MTRAPAERSPWWSRARGLPPEAYAAWAASLPDHPGRTPRILAWAGSSHGHCVATAAGLSYEAEDGPGATVWRHVGWHEIEHGGWNVETHRLTWRTYEDGPGSVELGEPGRIPELFRERVAASIAVQKFVPLTGERGVTITARRDLGSDAGISWHSTLTRGLSWQTEGVREAADRAMAELRTEYDLG